MEKQILLPVTVLRELKDTFKVGRNDLRRALNYERNSKRAKMLRSAALERGGLIYTKGGTGEGCHLVSVEGGTENGRRIYRLFKQGMELEVDCGMEHLTVKSGEIVCMVCDVDVQSWKEVLYFVQKVYNGWNS